MADSVGDRMVKATEPTRGPMFPWFTKSQGKQDTSWHDDMVKQANESFAKSKAAADPKLGGKKKTKSTKKKTKKSAAKRG